MPIRVLNILTLVTNIVLYFITFFVGMRVVLRFLSANPSTPVVAWIYNVSSALIYPFLGIFPDLSVPTGVLDMVAAIALLGYILVGVLLTWLFRTFAIATNEVTTPTATTTHYHNIDEDLKEEDHPHQHYSK